MVSCLAGNGAQMKNLSRGVFRRIKRDIFLDSRHRADHPSVSQNFRVRLYSLQGKLQPVIESENP